MRRSRERDTAAETPTSLRRASSQSHCEYSSRPSTRRVFNDSIWTTTARAHFGPFNDSGMNFSAQVLIIMLSGRSLTVNASRRTKKAADSAAANKHTRRTLGTLTCEPEPTTNPAQSEADNFAIILGQPHSAWIVSKAERLEIRRPRRGDRPETVADGQVVDAAGNQFFGACQFVSACRSDNQRHGHLPCDNL
jgi:hypothetical protein